MTIFPHTFVFGKGILAVPQVDRVAANYGTKTEAISVTVTIPTYRRSGPLIDCTRSTVRGSQLPHEINVIRHDEVTPSKEALIQAQYLCGGKTALRVDWVAKSGHIPPVGREPA